MLKGQDKISATWRARKPRGDLWAQVLSAAHRQETDLGRVCHFSRELLYNV